MRGCRSVSTLIVASVLQFGDARAAPTASPAEVIAAEREFAADAQGRGFIAAFKKYAAPDAIGFQPDPVNVQHSLAGRPNEPADRSLKWWPVWGGIAQSGDIGFTTGPYGSADKAWSDVAKLESALAAAAKKNTKAAYLVSLSDDARIMGSPAQPATDGATREAELDRRAATIDFSPLGGRASHAGDLVFTYGDAKWTRDGEARRGHYVRIWQMRTAGWKLVFDEILGVPPQKSAS